MITWTTAFETGIPSADYEHRKLVELVNELHDQARAAGSAKDAASALTRITAHFTAHFALEEEAMRAAGIAELEDHKRDHDELLGRIGETVDRLERGGAMTADIAEDIELWLVRHFHTWDRRLYRALDRAS